MKMKMKCGTEPPDSWGGECSQWREEPVQRPWGRNKSDLHEKQQASSVAAAGTKLLQQVGEQQEGSPGGMEEEA